MIINDSKAIANIYLLIILSLTYTASAFLPLLQYGMLFMIVGFIMPILLCPSFFGTRIFRWFLVYISIVFVNFILGDNYFDKGILLLYESAYMFIPASMVYYSFTKSDIQLQKRALVLFFIISLLTTIATAFFSASIPSLVRNSSGEDYTFYHQFFRFGLSNYFFPHALPCLTVPLVFGLRYTKKNNSFKVILWISLIILILLIYYSGSFACLIIALLGIVITLIIKPGTIRASLSKVLVVTSLALLILTPTIRGLLLDGILSSMNEDSDFYEKVEEMKVLNEGEDVSAIENGDVSARRELYGQSIEQGVGSLLWGSDGSGLGGHSAILDRFGTLGIIGIFPFFLFIYAIASYTVRFIPRQYRIYYYVGLSLSLLMFIVKAIFHWDQWLITLFIFPTLFRYILSKSEG